MINFENILEFCLAVTIIPVHNFVILLNFLLYVSKFILQIFTSLFFLQVRWILKPERGKVIFAEHSHTDRKYVNMSIAPPLIFPVFQFQLFVELKQLKPSLFCND